MYIYISYYIYTYPIDDPFPHVSLVPSRQGCEKAMRLAKEGWSSASAPGWGKDMAWDSLLSSFFSHFGWISGVFKDLLVLDGYRMIHLRQFADVWCRLSRHVLNCWQFFLRDVWIYHAQTSSCPCGLICFLRFRGSICRVHGQLLGDFLSEFFHWWMIRKIWLVDKTAQSGSASGGVETRGANEFDQELGIRYTLE